MRSSAQSQARPFLLAVVLATACSGLAAATHAEEIRAGTGFAISTVTHVVTNAHVVTGCASLRVLHGSAAAAATPVAIDEHTDLAVVQTQLRTVRQAALRSTPPLRLGEQVVSFGFPLSGSLSKEGNLTTGNISALAGLRDDPTYLQMSAPVQPGNSGGPLLDMSAHVVGVVTAKLDAVAIAKRTGDIPQNVNFAVKADVLRALLRASGLPFAEEVSDRPLQVADVAELARGFTVQIECVPGRSALPAPGRIRVVPRNEAPTPALQKQPAAAPGAPAPVVSDVERAELVGQVELVAVRKPYSTTAPETRELSLANRSERSVYKVTVGWLDQELARCPSSPTAYSGRRELFISLKPGEQGKTLGNFPPGARLFCIIDAAFLAPAQSVPGSEPPAPQLPEPLPATPAPEAPAPAEPHR